ncbi:hypothetical protein [Streptomyces sp. NPDC089799]|uniref:hypothetical protein n=1 Tax=Streptomyces sp. NPDC089799 TaxID=3155066 RepID=UPI00341DB50D
MKLKRVALVAAAAVAGPTVLMSAPAMAADQPAVVVPDAAPQDDTAGGTTGDDAEPKAPAKESHTKETHTKETPAKETPAAEKPAAKPAPKAEKSEKDQRDSEDHDDQDAPDEGMIMGPEVSVRGIPKDGFEPGGDWTRLTVEVDNTGHIAVPKFTPALSLMQWEGTFKTSQIKVERLTKDGWTPVKAVTGEEMGPVLQYPLGTTASVAANQVYTVDVRIRFTADVPVELFQLSLDGTSRNGGRTNHSPASWYETRIVGAEGGPEEPTVVEGPKLTVSGVPDGIVAGGGWTNLSVRIDNSGKDALKRFDAGLVIARPDWVRMKPSQLTVEVYSTQHGKKGWHKAEVRSEFEGYFFGIDLAGGAIPAGKSFDVQVRIKFAASSKPGDLIFRAFGFAEGDADSNTWVESSSKGVLSKLLPADTDTTPNPNPKPKPKPDTDTDTDTDTDSGTDTDTDGNTPSPNGGGELAATGADPATSWALGGAGVAVALGVALVAGTGRHRRRTTTCPSGRPPPPTRVAGRPASATKCVTWSPASGRGVHRAAVGRASAVSAPDAGGRSASSSSRARTYVCRDWRFRAARAFSAASTSADRPCTWRVAIHLA